MPSSLPPGLPIVPSGGDGGEGGNGGGDDAGGAADAEPFPMSEADFEAAVSDALDRIPPELAKTMSNVAIFIEDDYTPQPGEDPDTVLLGLYEGVPLTERDSWWDAGSLPDRITIYRRPILEICASREDVIEEVTVTVVHEIAHHFGISDARLHELGWG
ncbi:metallopeptidase family protein [Arthrobacter sp. NPDC058192]|uniref:metallopeptidase family protein n=1 Tax=Arthrobacter sp. NPDC058192 TaxID=3346372 RepID=UPI0036E32EC8